MHGQNSVVGQGREWETPEVPHACEIETMLGRGTFAPELALGVGVGHPSLALCAEGVG